MASSESPGSPSVDMDQDDKPRVFVDGPGGAETKQGAKIACLECRSAKIKCSAPTDGQVPCKRCVKHHRECLFEKHKRGRKPNKRFSVPSDLRAAARNGSEANPFENRPNSSGGRSDTLHASSHHKLQNSRNGGADSVQRKHDTSFSAGEGATNRHHFGDSSWKQSGHFGPAPGQALGALPPHYPDDRFHPAGEQYSKAGMSASVSAPSGIAPSGMQFAYAQPHHHPQPIHPPPLQHHQQHQFSHQHPLQQQQQQQQASSYPHVRHGSDHPSPGRWPDHPQPQAASSPHSSHSGAAAGKQHDSYAHGRNRPYPHNVPAPSHSYAHWDNQLGSERINKSRLELSPSRRTSSATSQGQQQYKNTSLHHPISTDNNTAQMHKSSQDQRSLSKGRLQRRDGASSHHHRSSSRGGAYEQDADEEYEDEQDELEDDADATREEHDYVLSNPLKLLAQASDAAAARIEGGRVEPGNRSSLAAVETMGLLQPSLPSNRMAVSAAVNLTGLGRPLYGRRDDDFVRSQRTWPSNRLLPPLLNTSRGAPLGQDSSFDASSRGPPPFLKESVRSKSFPENELPRVDASVALDESEPNTAVVPGSASSQISQAKTVSGAPLGRPNVLTPSTLDHEAWEYREGKAQARRGYGSSPGGISVDAVTTGSSVSAGAANAQKQVAASGINGASPGEIIESPAEEVTTAMLGKRKRGRSRAARGSGLPSRRRKLAEWDTDAENGEGLEEDGGADAVKGKQVTIAMVSKPKDANGVNSGGESEAGASRKGYFNLSLFHSKNDDTEGLDPVELGLVELKELERLFDVFFARINPVLDLFDPFLHSVAFVRMRSAFLTTVISSMAARFSETPQDAKLASTLDKHWQEKLLPMILLGGYKSVEISQAFLILTTYSRPTNRLVDDRSWQYLGFAIRTATEVGVNRKVTPSENLLGNEQVARRVRNRERLWFNLFLYDRTLSAQTGRPWTISEDRMIVQSSMWHRQDFALPEDVSLVSLIKLRRITAQHTEAFDTYLTSPDRFDETQTATALGVGGQSMFDRRLAGLEFFRKNANADLEKWKETWCINTEDKIKEVDTSTAAGKYLVRWAPTAKLFYYHSRLLINSLVLGATEQYEGFLSGSSVSVDCWTSAISLIDTVLNDFTEAALVTWSNDRVVMAVYAAVSAVRMTNLQHKYAFADKETLLALVRRLATSMTCAGKTPRHRNGSATPYGRYLKSMLAAFEPENHAVKVTAQSSSTATGQTPGKDSEQATSITTSSLAPGDSRSAAASPPTAGTAVAAGIATAATGAQDVSKGSADGVGAESAGIAVVGSGSQDGLPPAASTGAADVAKVSDGSDAALKTEDLVDVTDAVKTLGQVPLIVADGSGMDLDISAAASQLAAAPNSSLEAQTSMEKLLQMPVDGTATGMLTPSDAAAAGDVAWPAASVPGGITRPSSSSHSSSAGGADANGLLATSGSNMLLATPISPAAAGAAGMDASDGTAASAVDPVAAAAAAAAVTMPDVVDDPESLERMWNYMTAFEHTSFWQPQSTWNLSGGANNAGQHHHNGH